jgi:hypothetical protein
MGPMRSSVACNWQFSLVLAGRVTHRAAQIDVHHLSYSTVEEPANRTRESFVRPCSAVAESPSQLSKICFSNPVIAASTSSMNGTAPKIIPDKAW